MLKACVILWWPYMCWASHPCCNSVEVSLVMLGANLFHSAFCVLLVSSAEALTASSKFEVMFTPGMWRCSSTDFNGLSIAGIPVKQNKGFVCTWCCLYQVANWLTLSLPFWTLCRWWSMNKMVLQKMFQIALANFEWPVLDWNVWWFLMHKPSFPYFEIFFMCSTTYLICIFFGKWPSGSLSKCHCDQESTTASHVQVNNRITE